VVIQPADDSNSHWSWYDDNWYQLGNGFDFTIHDLILEASENYGNCYSETNSYLSLSEFSDSNYANLIASMPLFSGILSSITSTSTNKTIISGLNIALNPRRYYRLDTNYQCQNGSVSLKGTVTTGTAMWDMFLYGQGRVPYAYSFYPYLSWEGVRNFSPLAIPNPPPAISIDVDIILGKLSFSWSPAMYPDFSPGQFTYSVNCGTSPTLDDANWQSVGNSLSASCNIDPLKNYYVGVRATDNMGTVSLPKIELWSSPLGIPIAS
jgi:hypothetical protein